MKDSKTLWIILLTLFIAVVLSIVSLPDWAIWLRPLWVLMVLVYWTLALDRWVGVNLAWCTGIVMDIFTNTLLGTHALTYTIIVFLVMKLQKQIRVMPILQQSLIMFVIALVNLALIYWSQALTDNAPETWLFWLPTVTTVLLWPWVFAIMRACRRYFGVN